MSTYLNKKISAEPGATVRLCEFFVPQWSVKIWQQVNKSLFLRNLIHFWQKHVKWSLLIPKNMSLFVQKLGEDLVKTWITAAFFWALQGESPFFDFTFLGGRRRQNARSFFDGCQRIDFEIHPICWKQNIWRFGRNTGFTPPQRDLIQRCVLKNWGKQECV